MPSASRLPMTGSHNAPIVEAESDQALSLPDEDGLLGLYYDGGRLPSPSGGFLMVLGVVPEDEGSGLVFLECMSSSLRYRMNVPKATRSERKKVRDMIDEGSDPKCPRHQEEFLTRMRHDLACSKCGVRYAKAK